MDAATLLLGAGIALGSAAVGVVSEALKGWLVRRTTNEDKRKAFQHRTAVELQETLFRMGQQTNAFYFWNAAHFRETRHWGGAGLPPERDDDKWGIPRTRVWLLVERMDDDELRNAVQKLTNIGTAILVSETFEDATRLFQEHEDQLKSVNGLLGKIIRESWPD
jgi:hypothetical protein